MHFPFLHNIWIFCSLKWKGASSDLSKEILSSCWNFCTKVLANCNRVSKFWDLRHYTSWILYGCHFKSFFMILLKDVSANAELYVKETVYIRNTWWFETGQKIWNSRNRWRNYMCRFGQCSFESIFMYCCSRSTFEWCFSYISYLNLNVSDFY